MKPGIYAQTTSHVSANGEKSLAISFHRRAKAPAIFCIN